MSQPEIAIEDVQMGLGSQQLVIIQLQAEIKRLLARIAVLEADIAKSATANATTH